MDFMRKGTSHLKLLVPEGIRNGMGSIRLVAFDSSEIVSQEINFVAAAKEPEGAVTANIIHIGSGRYLTRNSSEETPRIMSLTGGKEQRFVFLPVEGERATYYIKNVATAEYLVCGDDNNWRMQWVTDPTSISNPLKGKYRIVELDGTDGYIQIRCMGSSMLGTDSNDENSGVYADKNGEGEPRFQWKLDIISGSFEIPEPSPVLYEGKFEFGDWNVLEITADQLTELVDGDVIRMSFYPEPDQYPQMDLRDSNDVSFPGFEWLGLDQFSEDGYVDFTVDSKICARLQKGGLLIRGSHYIITKVEILVETEE